MNSNDQQQDDEPQGPTDDQLVKVVDNHCTQLMEHFDAVRIFVVKHDSASDITRSVSRGRGNWYAQKGAIDDWIIQQNERTAADATRDEAEGE